MFSGCIYNSPAQHTRVFSPLSLSLFLALGLVKDVPLYAKGMIMIQARLWWVVWLSAVIEVGDWVSMASEDFAALLSRVACSSVCVCFFFPFISLINRCSGCPSTPWT